MRVTITGGLGFLGSFLAEGYHEHGHHVTVIDDLSGNVVNSIPGVDGVVADCAAPGLIATTAPDLVVHCASPVGAVAVVHQAGRIASSIMRTTRAVVDGCLETNAALVNVSTSEVYGFSGVYSETDDLRVPAKRNARLEYGVGKLAAEFTVQNTPRLRSLTLRPFNLAGPRQTKAKGFVIPTFIEQARRGMPLTVFAGGGQERAFTAVFDLADWLTTLDLSVLAGQVVNVGNPTNRTTITALAELVRDQLGSPSEIVQVDGKTVHGPGYEEAEGTVKVPNIERANALGFHPATSLEDLIVRSIRDQLATA